MVEIWHPLPTSSQRPQKKITVGSSWPKCYIYKRPYTQRAYIQIYFSRIVVMENTSSSFSSMLNSAITNGEPQNQISQQQHHFPPTQYPSSWTIHHHNTLPASSFNPQYIHICSIHLELNQYPPPQFPFTQGSFQGAYQGMRQQQQGAGQATPVGSTSFFQGARKGGRKEDIFLLREVNLRHSYLILLHAAAPESHAYFASIGPTIFGHRWA